MSDISIGLSQRSLRGDGTSEVDHEYFLTPSEKLFRARVGLINNIELSNKLFLSIKPYITVNFDVIDDAYYQYYYVFGGAFSLNYKFY